MHQVPSLSVGACSLYHLHFSIVLLTPGPATVLPTGLPSETVYSFMYVHVPLSPFSLKSANYGTPSPVLCSFFRQIFLTCLAADRWRYAPRPKM